MTDEFDRRVAAIGRRKAIEFFVSRALIVLGFMVLIFVAALIGIKP